MLPRGLVCVVWCRVSNWSGLKHIYINDKYVIAFFNSVNFRGILHMHYIYKINNLKQEKILLANIYTITYIQLVKNIAINAGID